MVKQACIGMGVFICLLICNHGAAAQKGVQKSVYQSQSETDPSRLSMVLQQHHSGTTDAWSLSPGANYLASADGREMKLWDAKAGILLKNFQWNRAFEHILFLDETHILTQGCRSVAVWNSETGVIVNQFELKLIDRCMRKQKIRMLKDKRHLLVAGITGREENHSIELWDIYKGRLVHTFRATSVAVRYPKFEFDISDKENLLIGINSNGTVFLWDLKTGAQIKRFAIPKQPLKRWSSDEWNLALSDDETHFLVRHSGSCLLQYWRIKDEKMLWEKKDDFGGGTILEIIPGNQTALLAYAGGGPPKKDKYIFHFNINTGETIKAYKMSKIDDLWVSPSGKHVVVKYYDKLKYGVFDLSVSPSAFFFKHRFKFSGDAHYGVFVTRKGFDFIRLDTKKVDHTIKGNRGFGVAKFAVRPNHWEIAVPSYDGNTYIWDIRRCRLKAVLKGDSDDQWIVAAAYSQNGRRLVTQGFTNIIDSKGFDFRVWDTRDYRLIKKFRSHPMENLVSFFPDGTQMLTSHDNKAIVRDLATFRMKKKYTHKRDFKELGILKNGDVLGVYFEKYDYDQLWNLTRKKPIKNATGNKTKIKLLKSAGIVAGYLETVTLPGNKKQSVFYKMDGRGKSVPSILTDEVAQRIGRKKNALSGYHRKLAFATDPEIGGLSVMDMGPYKVISKNSKGSSGFGEFAFMPGDTHLVFTESGGIVKVLNLQNNETVNMIAKGKQWLIYNNDGFFDTSRKGGDLAMMVKGYHSFRMDQTAIKYNRPGVILEKMNLGSPALIAHYKALHDKRVRKSGLREKDLDNVFDNAPVATFYNTAKQDGRAVLDFGFSDQAVNIVSYNIYVNDVPLFGAAGKKVNQKDIRLKQTVELAAGENKIELSAINALGSESLRPHVTFTCLDKTKGDLYYIGFGVSNYKDAALNLAYAAKDTFDLEKVFKKSKNTYNAVYTKVYTDAQVTLANIENAKRFLKTATVHDTVVLFVAGHGLYAGPNKADYYYLGYHAALDNIAQTAIGFEKIEDILQAIKPRNKLFLLDTCQSGEQTSGGDPGQTSSAGLKKLKSRGIRRNILDTAGALPMAEIVTDQNRYIYNDLFRRSGAIVFSSSRGAELSYESDAIKNGVFTEEIIKALTTKAADKNKNGWIEAEELKHYVTRQVSKQTFNLQHPTVDRDNIQISFALPVVSK